MEIEPIYRLPFGTPENPVRISQGRYGPWSHRLLLREILTLPGKIMKTDLINAVDFALPFGTPIWAAREGKVKDYWLDSDWYYEGLDLGIGNNPPPMSTNFIVIDHGDGTYAWYSHLSKDVLVERRQLVTCGVVIGTTGRSGWIAKIPHLHFHVSKDIAGLTIPVSFRDYHGSLDHATLLREGNIYFGEY